MTKGRVPEKTGSRPFLPPAPARGGEEGESLLQWPVFPAIIDTKNKNAAACG